jgi:pyruvate dehydrogenase E2 component (dihydrolipoamide acetyltransferase)
MATDFLMPKLGLTMEEGTILEWLVDDGANVEPGTPVLRIETDKVESDVEAAGSGRLHRLADVGSTHACGAVIALLLAEGEDAPAPSRPAAPAATPTAASASPSPSAVASTPAATSAPVARRVDGRIMASPNARRRAGELGVDLATVIGTGPEGRIVSEDVEEAAARPRPAAAASNAAVSAGAPTGAGSSVLATAAARQLADLLGVDLAAVAPDPADGRVSRDGVATYVRQLLSAARPAPATPSATSAPVVELPPASQTPTSVKRMSGMRGTIAKRMHASLQQMAQLTLTMDAEMDAVVADRESRKGRPIVPGFTDYVIAACARALRQHGIVNSQVTDDGIALLPDVHVGMAVALDEGLVVPVVRDAAHLDLEALAAETKRLAAAARSGSLALADLEGGTFSVSALGMFGVDAFTPVINPPNTAIMGVGRLRKDVVLDGDQVSNRTRLTLSFTWDHRVFDGAPAAEFTQTVCRLLASPSELDT